MKAVNLIPTDQRRGAGGLAGRSGGIVYVVVGGLAVVVALGVVYAFTVKSVADRTGQLADVTDQVNVVQAHAGELSPYVTVHQLRQSAVGSVVSLAETRFDWPDAMRQLALALPNDVSFTSFNASAGADAAAAAATATSSAVPTTTSSTGGGADFTLSGCASSQAEVATVMTQLARVPGVTGVALTSSVKDGKAPNAGRPVPRNKGLAKGGQCPLVEFSLGLTYNTTYTVPNTKLPGQTADTTPSVPSAPASSTQLASSTQPAGG